MSDNFESVLATYLSRRRFLKTTAFGLASASVFSCSESPNMKAHAMAPIGGDSSGGNSLNFRALSHGLDDNLTVADNYLSQVLIRWGDPIFPNLSEFERLYWFCVIAFR